MYFISRRGLHQDTSCVSAVREPKTRDERQNKIIYNFRYIQMKNVLAQYSSGRMYLYPSLHPPSNNRHTRLPAVVKSIDPFLPATYVRCKNSQREYAEMYKYFVLTGNTVPPNTFPIVYTLIIQRRVWPRTRIIIYIPLREL